MISAQDLEHGWTLLASGAYQDAEDTAQALLAKVPGDAGASLLAGLAAAAMGETTRAAAILTPVAASERQAEHPCVTFARLRPPFPRRLVGRLFQACFSLAPDDARLCLAYGDYLLDHDQAAQTLEVLAGAPDTVAVHHLRGLARAELGQFAAAMQDFARAAECDPLAAASWSNYGVMLAIEGRFADASLAHDRAVALAPDDPRFRVNRAVAHLRAGDWDQAWRDYEARLDMPGSPSIDKTRLLPHERVAGDLSGITVAALHEDGFGDTLHFCRYLPLLAERGARVLACVPVELERLMRGIPGVAAVYTDTRQLPPHEFICPMFSLPGIFRTRVETIPPPPVLTIDPALRQQWHAKLPDRPGLRVGLVWAGQARPTVPGFATLDRRRSAGLSAFAPLFDVPGVTFISLQKGPEARQAPPSGAELFDPMPEVRDFADTAAIISNLDVVISVDTSVVHLAGLVGVPVFLMDRYDNCWRWLHGRDDSPWYPKLRIFRQQRPHDWPGAMARAAAALRGVASAADRPASVLGMGTVASLV